MVRRVEKPPQRPRRGALGLDHRKVPALRKHLEVRVRQLGGELFAVFERGDAILAAPQEQHRLVDLAVVGLHFGEALPAHRGERGRGGAGALERALGGVDQFLRDVLRIVERERDLVVRPLAVKHAEQHFADARRARPHEGRGQLIFVDPRVVERQARHARRSGHGQAQRHARPPRVRHQRGALDAELVHHREHQARFGERRVVTLGAIGPAETLEIERHHAVIGLEIARHVAPRLERRGEAVEQHHGRPFAAIHVAHARAAGAEEGGALRLAGHRPVVKRHAAAQARQHRERRERGHGLHGDSLRISATALNSGPG